MPTARASRDDLIRLRGTPRSLRVLIHRRVGSQDRINDGPRGLHFVLTCEVRRVANHGAADQALVCVHLVSLLLRDEQLDVPTLHSRPGLLGVCPKRDGGIRANAEPQVVGSLGSEVTKDSRRRRPKIDHHLRGSDWKTLPGPQIKRHAAPTPGIDLEFQCRVGFDFGIRRDSRLLAVAPELPAHQVVERHRPDRLQHFDLLVT